MCDVKEKKRKRLTTTENRPTRAPRTRMYTQPYCTPPDRKIYIVAEDRNDGKGERRPMVGDRVGWGIAKHIYNGSGRDRRDCASWYTGEKPSHQILQKKTETDNKGGRDTMLHFFTEHAIDFFTVLCST